MTYIVMRSVQLLDGDTVTFSPDDAHPSGNGIYANRSDLDRATCMLDGYIVTDNDADEPLSVLVSHELMRDAHVLLAAQ